MKLEEVKSGLRSFDLFGQGVPLRIGGKPLFRTTIGFIFTMIYLAVMLAIFITQMLMWSDTTSPKTVGELYNVDKYPKINLRDNKLLPVFLGYSNETELIKVEEMESFFTLKYQMVKWTSFELNMGGTNKHEIRKSVEELPYKPCNQLSPEQISVFDFVKQDPILYGMLRDNGICPLVPPDTFIEGKDSDERFIHFTLKVLPCSLRTGCKTASEITLANFQLILPQSNFKTHDTDNPHTFVGAVEDVYYINPNMRQIHSAVLKNFLVYDYEGYYPKWNLQSSVFDFDNVFFLPAYRSATTSCLKAEVEILDNPSCLPYFEFNIRSTGRVLKNKRTYLTLMEVLANVGGLNVIMVAVVTILYKRLNDSRRKEYLSEEVHRLVQRKHHHEQEGENLEDENELTIKVDIKDDPRYEKILEDSGTWKCTIWYKKCIRKLKGEQVTDRKCFCCKKKTQREMNAEKKKILALKYIDQVLDVTNIIRNFNQLKVITHFLFRERHFEMAQYLGFGLAKKDFEADIEKKILSLQNEQQIEKEKENLSDSQEKALMGLSKKDQKETENLVVNFHKIKEGHDKNQLISEKLSDQLTDELDVFYYSEYKDMVTDQILPPIEDPDPKSPVHAILARMINSSPELGFDQGDSQQVTDRGPQPSDRKQQPLEMEGDRKLPDFSQL